MVMIPLLSNPTLFMMMFHLFTHQMNPQMNILYLIHQYWDLLELLTHQITVKITYVITVTFKIPCIFVITQLLICAWMLIHPPILLDPTQMKLLHFIHKLQSLNPHFIMRQKVILHGKKPCRRNLLPLKIMAPGTLFIYPKERSQFLANGFIKWNIQ